MKKSRYIALICGGVSIVVTVMFYLMTFDNIFMAEYNLIMPKGKAKFPCGECGEKPQQLTLL